MSYVKSVDSINSLRSKSCSFSHQGHRLQNEDFYIADDLHGIYILTDGMGGYKGGGVACRIAAHACHDYLIRHRKDLDIADDMLAFIRSKLKEAVRAQPSFVSMGTTLCCLYIEDNHVNLIHIGDSKIIIVGDLIYQSKDHTYAQQLVDQDFIQADAYRHHPMRHILTRCLTANTDEKFKADFRKIPLKTGRNTFFLCSDGVMEALSELETIQLIIEEQDIHKIIQEVEQQTLKYSNDNSTAIIVGFNYGTSQI